MTSPARSSSTTVTSTFATVSRSNAAFALSRAWLTTAVRWPSGASSETART
jgi:hypothetical protein